MTPEAKVREQIITRLVERLDKAVVGVAREEIIERYVPVFRKMTDYELKGVWEKALASTDAQLYLIDESAYHYLQKKPLSPGVGRAIHTIFEKSFPSPAR